MNGKGWHGDTPGHKAAAVRKGLSTALRVPMAERNRILIKSKWKKILYNALLNYCRERFNIHEPIILKFIKPTDRKRAGDINLLGRENIILVEDDKIDVTASVILHEITHIKQKLNGELSAKDGMLLWNNKPMITVNDYENMTEFNTVYSELPWENEARTNSNLVEDFFKSVYYQSERMNIAKEMALEKR